MSFLSPISKTKPQFPRSAIPALTPSLMFISLTFATLLLLAPAGHAWGCKGHQTVALLAERHLTPEAKQFLLRLLTDNPVDPELKRYCGSAVTDLFADASTWPDDIRSPRDNGPWHYIDIPRGESRRKSLDQYCGEKGCVTRAITEQLAVLKDPAAGGVKRAEALRYIIHFVGDLHQPLHAITNADEGGNCVPVKYLRREPREHANHYSPNLHAVWDTAILERDMESADPTEFAEHLDESFSNKVEAWQTAGIHLDDWVWESFDEAEKFVYEPLVPKIAIEPDVPVHACTDDNHIGARLLQQHITANEAYQQQAAGVVEQRIAQAGIRLALILDEATKTPAR
jgi:S1/P1 Nuclease